MSEAELKPCPFCGGDAAVENDGFYRWVECKNKNCEASAKVFAFISDAGNANDIVSQNWNTRPLEDALLKRAEAAEARAERLEDELSEVVAYGGYYADIENRLPPDGQVIKVIASSTHGVDDFTVLRLDEKWYFASDPPREVPGEFEVIRIKPWNVKRFGASYDEEF